MVFILEPIIIAAIAAGGTAVLVLVLSTSIFLYRRHNRCRQGQNNQNRLIPGTASTSTSSSTHKGGRRGSNHNLNPYKSPVVPLVQPPPVHSQRRNNARAKQDPAVYTPESTDTLLRTPDSTPPNAKLRKLERLPYTSLDKNRPLPPETPDIYSGSTSPLSNPGRMSAASSIMLITYEQGLAKLGLSAPRAPPAAYTTSPVSSASPGIVGLGDPAQSAQTQSSHTGYRSPRSVSPGSPSRPPAGRGNIARKPVPTRYSIDDIPYDNKFEDSKDVERGEGRWAPLQPGNGAGWEERERRAPSGPMDAWLPSYYQSDDDEENRVPPPPVVMPETGHIGSKSRWGGRI